MDACTASFFSPDGLAGAWKSHWRRASRACGYRAPWSTDPHELDVTVRFDGLWYGPKRFTILKKIASVMGCRVQASNCIAWVRRSCELRQIQGDIRIGFFRYYAVDGHRALKGYRFHGLFDQGHKVEPIEWQRVGRCPLGEPGLDCAERFHPKLVRTKLSKGTPLRTSLSD